jgi:predicted dehydrogenase
MRSLSTLKTFRTWKGTLRFESVIVAVVIATVWMVAGVAPAGGQEAAAQSPAPPATETPATAAESAPVRLGILGVDNYQSVAFTQLFHDPKAAGDLRGVRVVAAWPGTVSEDIPESVANLAKWEKALAGFQVKIVPSVREVLEVCDGVLVMPLDGRKHRELAEAAIKAGKRVYVGRPLAADFAEAHSLLKLARETKTPLWTSSQHRFSPGFLGMRNHPEVGAVLGCDVYGGCPTVPHHAELVWHALHGIETLFTIMGPGCVSVQSVSTPTAESVTGVWGDGRLGTFRGIKTGAVKYSATVFGDKGVSIAGVYGHGVPVKGVAPTNDKYMGYEGIAIELAKFFKGGAAPVSLDETREIFAFMEAAQLSKQRGGQPVKLAEVLANR